MPRINEIILSLIIGILTSLGAQGVWSFIFAWINGNLLEQLISASLLLIIVAFGLDVGAIWWLRKMLNKKDVNEISHMDILKSIETIRLEQQKTNSNLDRIENKIILGEKRNKTKKQGKN